MAALSRLRVAWTGFNGAPGVSTFYALDAIALVTPLEAFLTGLHFQLPPDVNLQLATSGDIIESTTGALTGAWSTSPVSSVQGDTAGAYAAPAGVAVTWLTSSVLDGKRVKGRTYVVPVAGSVYATDGTIIPAQLTSMTSNAATFVAATAGNLVIWHRPRLARAATTTRPAVAARPGGHAVVTGSRVTDKVAVLRSRRD